MSSAKSPPPPVILLRLNSSPKTSGLSSLMASLSHVRRLVVPRPEVGGGVTGMTVCVKVPLCRLLVVVPGAPLPPFPGGPPGPPTDRGLNLSTVVDTCAVSSMFLWVVLKLWCGVWVGPVLI